jgi:uncharacterized membrane protein YcaP (DUF421 family)
MTARLTQSASSTSSPRRTKPRAYRRDSAHRLNRRLTIFHLEISGWSVVARTAIVYFALLLGLRIAGKRELGQMTPFDLVVILLVANAVQNAMVGPDTSVTGGIIAATVLIGGNYLLAEVKERVPWFRSLVEGTPTVLISKGKVYEENLLKEGLSLQELMMAIRDRGVDSIEKVGLAVLEVNGDISVVPLEDSGGSGTKYHPRRARRFMRR